MAAKSPDQKAKQRSRIEKRKRIRSNATYQPEDRRPTVVLDSTDSKSREELGEDLEITKLKNTGRLEQALYSI